SVAARLSPLQPRGPHALRQPPSRDPAPPRREPARGGAAPPPRGGHPLSAPPGPVGGAGDRRPTHPRPAPPLLPAPAVSRGPRQHAPLGPPRRGLRQHHRGACSSSERAIPVSRAHRPHYARAPPPRDPALRGRGGLPADPGSERPRQPRA